MLAGDFSTNYEFLMVIQVLSGIVQHLLTYRIYVHTYILLSFGHAKSFLRTLKVTSVHPKTIFVYKLQYIYKEFVFHTTV